MLVVGEVAFEKCRKSVSTFESVRLVRFRFHDFAFNRKIALPIASQRGPSCHQSGDILQNIQKMVHFLLRCMIFGAIFEFSNAFIPQIPSRHHRHIHLQPIFATSWSKIITKGRSDSLKIVLAGIALLNQCPGVALAADASSPQSAPTIFVDTAPPKITDTCWIDLNRVGTDEKERVEIGLFGIEKS